MEIELVTLQCSVKGLDVGMGGYGQSSSGSEYGAGSVVHKRNI